MEPSLFTVTCVQVPEPAPPDLAQRLEQELPRLQGRPLKAAGPEFQFAFAGPSEAVRGAAEIHRICDGLARDAKQELYARIAAHTGEEGAAATLASRMLLATSPCETCVTAETWAGLGAEDRQGFAPHGPEVFKGSATFCLLHKKIHPNPYNDLTFRPESAGDEECSRQFTDAMPKHARYALVLEHPQANKTIVLSEGETHVIGRAPECGTVIPDRMLSGTHTAFAVVEGILWCFDLQSSNGVAYRGRPIRRRKPIEKNSIVQLPNGSVQVKLP